MSDQMILLHQSPDHVAVVGEVIEIEGNPYIVRGIKPKREAGCFLDYGRVVEYNEVELTVERFDGNPA